MTRRLIALLVAAVVALGSVAIAAPAQAATLTVAQYEAQIATYVNDARAKAGLPRLTVSTSISNVARRWSGAMASSGSFGHNPSYTTQIPAGWTSVAENVAWVSSTAGQRPPLDIHTNLMNSAGHRANILGAGYNYMGIGVSFVTRGGSYYVYLTQNFARYPSGIPADGPSVSADAPFSEIVMTPDQTSDGFGDVFTVDSDGRLFLYAGSGGGTIRAAAAFGTGWSSYDLYGPGDWNGDRRSDLLAVDGSGNLYLYPGTGTGSLGSRSQAGFGWTGLRIVPAGDVTSDGRADLLAIDRSGVLWLYAGAGGGAFARRVQVGSGWGSFALYAAGDATRDGRRDIFGVDSSGRLFLYPGTGRGTFGKRTQVGNGWTGMKLTTGADLDGSGTTDLLAKDSAGRVWFFPGRVGGTFGTKVQVASGW